jgi:hypothetical protein
MLGQRQIFLNEHLPCASLADQRPLVAHLVARFPRRLYRPEWETELLDDEIVRSFFTKEIAMARARRLPPKSAWGFRSAGKII